VGVGGVADVPSVINLTWPVTDLALNEFAWALGGADDQHATARYRRELVRRIGKRLTGEVYDALP
jgi:2-furoyl-CoA dehydrogenase FAD binding subunit